MYGLPDSAVVGAYKRLNRGSRRRNSHSPNDGLFIKFVATMLWSLIYLVRGKGKEIPRWWSSWRYWVK